MLHHDTQWNRQRPFANGLYVYKCSGFSDPSPRFTSSKCSRRNVYIALRNVFFVCWFGTRDRWKQMLFFSANVRLLLSRLLRGIHVLTEPLQETEKQTFSSGFLKEVNMIIKSFIFCVLYFVHHTCHMLWFNRPRFHHKLFSSIKGYDWVFRLALPVVTTATVIGELDDLLKLCCVPIGWQSIMMFAWLDTIYHRGGVPGAEREM